MTSNKSIASAIIQSYSGNDRSEVLKALQQSAQAARADERAVLLGAIADHRKLLKQSLEGRTDKLERFKIVQSIKTLDALVAVVS